GRQHDKWKHGDLWRFEPRNLRATVGEVAPVWRFKLPRRGYAVWRITGHQLVNGSSVIEQARWRITEGPDQRGLVHLLGHEGHGFRERDTGHVRFDGLELAADIGGGVWLGIPDIDMARSALE